MQGLAIDISFNEKNPYISVTFPLSIYLFSAIPQYCILVFH